jgi:hypothetical protein
MTDTSRDAYGSMQPHVERLEAMVFVEIKRSGSYGACSFEIEERLGMIHQTISARITGLKRKGLIRPNGKKRLTQSKRWASVLVAVPMTPVLKTPIKLVE